MMKPLKLLPQFVLAVFSLAVALDPAVRYTVAGNWKVVDPDPNLPYAISLQPQLLMVISIDSSSTAADVLPPASSLNLGVDTDSHLPYLG